MGYGNKKKTLNMKHHLKGPYDFFQTWTNGTVTIEMGAVPDILNIQKIKPYKIPEVD